MMTVPQSHLSAAEASEVLAYCTETRTQQRVSSGVAKKIKKQKMQIVE